MSSLVRPSVREASGVVQDIIEIVSKYEDRISGAKARRPGLDQMMKDARRGQFDVVLVSIARRCCGTALMASR